MPREKLTAIITGAISLLLAIAYLVLVQVMDFRGEMKPAPMMQIPGIQQQGALSGFSDFSISPGQNFRF